MGKSKKCSLCPVEKKNLSASRKCKKHKYCFECLSKLVVSGYQIENCQNCNKYFIKKNQVIPNQNIERPIYLDCKKFNNNNKKLKQCEDCKETAQFCKLCRKHIICKNCLFQNPEKLQKKNPKCKICSSIVVNNCRNCFIFLKDDQKHFKTSCKKHIYCYNCLQVQNTYCSDCNTTTYSEPSTASLYNNPGLNIASSSNYAGFNTASLSNYPGLNLASPSSILSGHVYQPLIICNFCSSGPAFQLDCQHRICENCLKRNFQNDLASLIILISTQDLNSLNNSTFSIRCPVLNCPTKYISPFNYSWAQPYTIQYNLSEAVLAHFSDIFNGVNFVFLKCFRCNFVSGHLNGICAYCRLS